MENIWEAIDHDGLLSEASRQAWEKIMIRKEYKKDDFFIMQDEVPTRIGIVSKGLFSKYTHSNDGQLIISMFFPEKSFMNFSLSYGNASGSPAAIRALEDSVVWEYDFHEEETKLRDHFDIAKLQSKYIKQEWAMLEDHWHITHNDETGKMRYVNFLKDYPTLRSRVKDFEIAAYLRITVDQLRKIRAELN